MQQKHATPLTAQSRQRRSISSLRRTTIWIIQQEKGKQPKQQQKKQQWQQQQQQLQPAAQQQEPKQMISASLIKLYIAGCYLERVYKAGISDKYDRQLFKMLSESDNASANTLIDALTRDTVNRFISNHGFKASKLNRKMLQKNGTENYTSAADCGRVLREVYKWAYVSEHSANRSRETARRSPQVSRRELRPQTKPANYSPLIKKASA